MATRRWPGRAPPRPDAGTSDRGSVTLELVVVFPAFLVVLLLTVQAAMFAHARNVATAAAQEGLRAARLAAGSADAGRTAAAGFLAAAGDRVLTTPVVTADRTAGVASVTVAGRALSVLPGLSLPVRAAATGPVERFTPDVGGVP